jgi:hypothetical protein
MNLNESGLLPGSRRPNPQNKFSQVNYSTFSVTRKYLFSAISSMRKEVCDVFPS